jgi:tetratricopeptide (TPR) repeat protein
MIKKTIISGIILLFFSAIVMADGNESLFELANQKYSEGYYDEAISSYEEILTTGYSSAALYYNLGNAYYKTNEVTKAILNYERALLLSPGDEDIKYNLEIANQLVADKINNLPEFFITKWFKQIRTGLSPDKWALISLVSFAVMAVFALMFFFLRSRFVRKLSLAGAVLFLLLSTASLVFGRLQYKQFSERNTAIIFSPSVTAKSSPDQGGTDLFVLHEGVKVWISDHLNGWLEIQLADGNKAWIPENSLERI